MLQERLPVHVQTEILLELRTLEQVRETLDIVDIVMGFLSSGGGNEEKSLGEYVEKVLKMKTRNLSQKVQYYNLIKYSCNLADTLQQFLFTMQIRQYCKLGHMISLWETLSVELARQLYLRGEVISYPCGLGELHDIV